MPVTPDDVRHVAALARLGVDEARLPSLVEQLNGILGHMEALGAVDTARVQPATGVGVEAMPLREDKGPPVPLERPLEAFAPKLQDGLILVPRLATHEEPA